ncbi:MAG: hypothetical protein PHU85_04195 [Phycisphaerae bacterium]|nr:hypothetical protein [Phycisphaerae bacterium]
MIDSMRLKVILIGGALVIGAAAGMPAVAAGPASAPDAASAGRLEILNAASHARISVGVKTPVYAAADGQVKPIPLAGPTMPFADFELVPDGAGWMQPDFDDSNWYRDRLPYEPWARQPDYYGSSHRLLNSLRHLLRMRLRFQIDDPAKVNDLRLSLPYIGGAVVYLNGQELTRGHLPAGQLATATPGEAYKIDPFTGDNGRMYWFGDYWWAAAISSKSLKAGDKERYDSRWRHLREVAVPATLLRKGVNVLAIENHAAPMGEKHLSSKPLGTGRGANMDNYHAYCGLGRLSLTAEPGSAAVANTARPDGVQVWSCAPWAMASGRESYPGGGRCETFGDPGPARISMVGTRNGVFSGRLVVSSSEALGKLEVKASDMTGVDGKAKIPASAIRIRYASRSTPDTTWANPCLFDALLDDPPAQVPVQPDFKIAMAQVWATVRIPADAAPGAYKGTLTVTIGGQKQVEVPIDLKVHGWRMPDPKDFLTYQLGSVCIETPAMYYQVPFWSDKHFELIGKTLELMAELGSRMVLANLAVEARTHANAEGLIRWIKQPDGSYKHDFTIFDKYMDVVAAKVGKPFPLALNFWGGIGVKDGKKSIEYDCARYVTVADPATGKLDRLEQPFPDEPAAVTFWKPVLDEVRKRLEKRNWFDTTGAGDCRYSGGPNPQTVSNLKAIWPDGKWFNQEHQLLTEFAAADGSKVPVLASTTVWNQGPFTGGSLKNLWPKQTRLTGGYARNLHNDSCSLPVFVALPEEMVMRGHNGVGPLGGNYWPLKDKNGRLYNMGGESALGPQCSTKALIVPGPQGPVASARFEAFRGGVQSCEAILYLQRALDEGKVTGELAVKVRSALDERIRAALASRFPADDAFITSADYTLSDRLFSACAEVAAAIGHER